MVRRRLVLIGGPVASGPESAVAAVADGAGVDPSARAQAGRHTLALAVALVVTSVAVLAATGVLHSPAHEVSLSWWVLGLVAALALVTEFDVEFRREAVTFTFSEVLLVIGLFLASPWSLVIGRLVGEGLVLVAKERQPLRKTVLNLASSLAELTTLFVVYDLLGGGTDVTVPTYWLMALLAVACADLVGYAVIHRALRWHGAPITFRSLLRIAVITVPVNTSFALVIGILLVDRPVGALLLLGVGGFLVLSYRSYQSLRQRFESLSLLYDFTRLVSGAQRPDAVLEAMLAQAKDLLRAERGGDLAPGRDDAASERRRPRSFGGRGADAAARHGRHLVPGASGRHDHRRRSRSLPGWRTRRGARRAHACIISYFRLTWVLIAPNMASSNANPTSPTTHAYPRPDISILNNE